MTYQITGLKQSIADTRIIQDVGQQFCIDTIRLCASTAVALAVARRDDHVGEDAPYVPTLVEGAKAVQLADLAYRSVAEGRWMSVPELRL